MKVLVATTQTQGMRDDDFSRTVSGELVFDGGPCGGVTSEADWDCECSIAFRGLASGELTTTAMVADLPTDLKAYGRAFRDGLAGQFACCRECARLYAHNARMLALKWPVGTIIERDQLTFGMRQLQ